MGENVGQGEKFSLMKPSSLMSSLVEKKENLLPFLGKKVFVEITIWS